MAENIKKFEPKFESISDVNLELKDKEIDLKKTIKKVLSKDIGINHEMSVEVEDYGWDFSELNIELFSDEFYDKLEEIIPDLVLLDIMLPDEDGYKIVRRLRSNPKTRKTPVIMITAKTAEMDMVKGLDDGADDYIRKPFSVM